MLDTAQSSTKTSSTGQADVGIRLTENAMAVLKRRYLRKGADGQPIETVEQMFRRVVGHVAAAEETWGGDVAEAEAAFYDLLTSFRFMPNSPTFTGAGTPLGQLAACFTADVRITTDRGPRRIADLCTGDQVLTHEGRYRPVSHLFRRAYRGPLLRIKVKLIGTSLEVTPEHPFLTPDGWVKAGDLVSGSKVATGMPSAVYQVPCFDLADLTYADGLEVKTTKEKVAVRRPSTYQRSGRQARWVNRSVEVTPELARLCGYYIAEGTIDSDECYVRFTFGGSEREYQDDVSRLIEDTFGVGVSRRDSNHGDWSQIDLYSRPVAVWFRDQFGKGACDKYLPVWLQHATPEIQEEFLSGLMRGDGMYSERSYMISGRESPKLFRALRLTLSNPGLIQQVWQMFVRLGYNAAIRQVDTTYVTENASDTAQISLPPLQSRELVRRAFGVDLPEPDERYVRRSVSRQGGRVYYEIERVDIEDYTGTVYNLEVDVDHSYVAEGVVVHNCFVLPVADDMGRDADGIFQTLRNAALIQQTGGGTGFSFSRLRPRGATVRSSGGQATGPVGFMRVFDVASGIVSQGGARRGANMAVLQVDHPDIHEFIHCKSREHAITNFNISVGLTDDFMQAVEENDAIELVNPQDGKVWKTVQARDLFDEIAAGAHRNGEPGVLFLDTANRDNPCPHLGDYEATNPCVTGDTLVAVADGRGAVPICELAEAGQDVLVYCQGPDGIVIQWGRNPRKTGTDMSVFEVELDDGSTIRATADHKFMLRDGSYKPLFELQPGDRLMPFNKYHYGKGELQRYWAVHLNQPGNNVAWAPEHRMIIEFVTGETIRYPDKVVHHRNYDGFDNSWDNLEIMTVAEHDALHREDMLGDSNPMRDKWWNQLSEEEKQAYRDKMSAIVSGENNPMYGKRHSPETRRKIGAATEARMDRGMRQLIGRRIHEWYAEHGTEFLQGERVERVQIPCAHCGKILQMTTNELDYRREANKSGKVFCSQSCANYWRGEHTELIKYTREIVLEKGKVYYEDTGKLPTISAWDEWRQSRGDVCCHETVRQRFGGFRKFRTVLKEALDLQNHKVVAIRSVGKADVYNVTVDEHHNYSCITNPGSETRFGGSRMTGVIVKNCGEQYLLPYENCCLGSINLAQHVGSGDNGRPGVDWEKLRETVGLAVRFLDDVVDANGYVPAVPQLKEAAHLTRRIGLGIMGLGDLMYCLGVRYGSDEAQELAAQVMEFIRYHAMRTSAALARERGPFPEFRGSIYDPDDFRWTPPRPFTPYMRLGQWKRPQLDWELVVEDIRRCGIRNAAQTTVAPTGTIATISGCEAYGCEPVFALAYVRHVNDNGTDMELRYTSPIFLHALEQAGLDAKAQERVLEQVILTGSCQAVEELPPYIRDTFVVASDITAEEHVRMQAALQAFVDASISKTINCPADATSDDVARAFKLAWKLGCKGLTVYVTGSREKIVLETEATRQARQSPEQQAQSAAMPKAVRRPRPHVLKGVTYRKGTPLGTAYVTVNANGGDEPFEVFLTVGKAGSDTAAVAEAIGRLISLVLRIPSPFSATRRLKQVVTQLKGIGGGQPLGFGRDRVRSLPDGVAQVLAEHLGMIAPADEEGGTGQLSLFPAGDLCPECGHAALVNEEGCRRCYSCGHSEC